MKFNKCILASVLSIIAFSANATIKPTPISKDGRIMSVQYDRNEVIEIPTGIGVSTLIQLEDDEEVAEDDNKAGAGLGDLDAWQVDIRGNNIFIKPKARNPDTNMVIVTNKRTYALSLKSSAKGKAGYIVRFSYPDTQLAEEQAALKNSLAIQNKIASSKGEATKNIGKINMKGYFMRGDSQLAPKKMWDDGRFTYLQYPNSKDLPAVYRILPDGKEMLVNTHIDNDVMVLQETAKGYMLRLGQSVLEVRNALYDPEGKFNALGTSQDDLIRLELGSAE
ncbi:TrbG/VirB9 family P-type conjugative transfer protein [Acinetobacter baumannii]|uniref:TrbG/VirB9 family P-type conjugative transfer protein n=1 Tax=Acinetobacter baumannii TaxID=470 RepID=UPI002341671A|nr:TrbG/VirB9 family P-type conjugative transfer protein [Acinetobacter baumannii]MDC4147465.1 TrbG/VirB9 family P-type conjugative transfer protein [Acinetobacter baumannii]